MAAQGLKTQTYKTGGRIRRALLCIALGAFIWMISAQIRAHYDIPLAFSLLPKATQAPQATQTPAQEASYATHELTLTGRSWYALQLGAFTQENAAWQLSQEFIPRGAAGYVCADEDIYRVYAAAYPTRAEAQSVQTRLSDQGVTTYIQPCNEPALTLRAGGTEKQVEAVGEVIAYLDALSSKFYTLSTALDAREMDETSAMEALQSECSTCLALSKSLESAFSGDVAPVLKPLQELLGTLCAEGANAQNSQSAARIGAALKRCQLTVTVGLKEFSEFLSTQ